MIDRDLILAMRAARGRGENMMACARERLGSEVNETQATLLAYDLLSGGYVRRVRNDPESNRKWCRQLAEILEPLLGPGDRLLEAGCGEATTLGGVLQEISEKSCQALGFDISWSRCSVGVGWLAGEDVAARLFVADLFAIPLQDSSVDVVFSSHALEPNGGREEAAVAELLRVARKAVVLVEPIYELAPDAARERMRRHGYVRGLKQVAEKLGRQVLDCRLLPYTANPLNPSGVVVIQKMAGETSLQDNAAAPLWRCPHTGTGLADCGDAFFSSETGLAYPVLRGIPLLRVEHAVVASLFSGSKQHD